MDPQLALATARRLVREHGLTGWTVRLDRAKTRAGVCRFARREIGLSGPLTRLHTPEEVRDTILHEIAHALVGPEHGHDAVWRAKAREIGCSGERCVSQDSPTVRGDWLGTCPAGHTVARHRRPKRVRSCSRCTPGRFDPTAIFEWTHRGHRAPMLESYRQELAAIRAHYGTVGAAPRRPAAAAPPSTGGPSAYRVGDLVRVLRPGPLQGVVAEVEFVGSARLQIRVAGELYAAPYDAVEAVPVSA
jgi:predicted SprT family Zn-dependent metalloprotease